MTVQKFWDDIDASTAIMESQFFNGKTPLEFGSSGSMDSLMTFVNNQQAYGASIGVANPTLYAFEALGQALAEGAASNSAAYAYDHAYTSHGLAADLDWVINVYRHISDIDPTTAITNHYVGQLNYFDNLYQGAGFDPARALTLAHGAVAGQMMGNEYLAGHNVSDYVALAWGMVSDAEDTNGSAVGFNANGIAYYGIT